MASKPTTPAPTATKAPAEKPAAAAPATERPARPKNNVQVGTQRSKFMYADLTKHLLNGGEKEVVITALNLAIPEAVAVVEMLKSQKMVEVTKIRTSRGETETARRNSSDKIEIVVVKAKGFDALYAEQQKEREERAAAKGKAKPDSK